MRSSTLPAQSRCIGDRTFPRVQTTGGEARAEVHFPRGQTRSGSIRRVLLNIRLEHSSGDTRLRFVLSSHIAWQSKLPTLRLRVGPLCEKWPRIDARARPGALKKRFGTCGRMLANSPVMSRLIWTDSSGRFPVETEAGCGLYAFARLSRIPDGVAGPNQHHACQSHGYQHHGYQHRYQHHRKAGSFGKNLQESAPAKRVN